MIELLSRRFVPVAVDEWYHIRRKDSEGEFYRKVVYQREGLSPREDRTTQGFYIFDPDGKLLRGWNNRDLPKLKRYLEEILKSYSAPSSEKLEGKADPRYSRSLEEGGVVVDVFSKITRANWPPAEDKWQELFRRSTGRDHLWILKDEVRALAAGELPPSLKQRLVRFHLLDNTRGEPPMWRSKEVREANLRLTPDRAGGHRLEGTVLLRTEDSKRSYEASVLGRIDVKDGKLVRFDVVCRGEFEGESTFTRGAPPGKFTLVIAFQLAQGGESDKVPPQGARNLEEYLRSRAD